MQGGNGSKQEARGQWQQAGSPQEAVITGNDPSLARAITITLTAVPPVKSPAQLAARPPELAVLMLQAMLLPAPAYSHLLCRQCFPYPHTAFLCVVGLFTPPGHNTVSGPLFRVCTLLEHLPQLTPKPHKGKISDYCTARTLGIALGMAHSGHSNQI